MLHWIVCLQAASTSALSFTLPAAGQAMFASKDDAPESMQDAIHRYGGLAIAALMVVQVGLGTLTNLWLRGDTRPPRHWWLVKRVHRVIGYLELWAAVGNVLLGVRLLLGWFYLYVAVAFASVVALTLVTASVVVRRQRYARPPDDKPLSTAIGKPLQTVAAGTSRTHTNARRRRCCGCLMRRNQVSAAEVSRLRSPAIHPLLLARANTPRCLLCTCCSSSMTMTRKRWLQPSSVVPWP